MIDTITAAELVEDIDVAQLKAEAEAYIAQTPFGNMTDHHCNGTLVSLPRGARCPMCSALAALEGE